MVARRSVDNSANGVRGKSGEEDVAATCLLVVTIGTIMKALVVFPHMRLLAWMLLPPADDQLELPRALQQTVGGFVEVGLQLPNGDEVCITGDSPKPGFFWLPPASRWLPGVGVIVGPALGCDVNSTYEAILKVMRWSRTGTDPLPPQ
jgi:hypothetical protein